MNKKKLVGLIKNPEKLPAIAYNTLPTDRKQVIVVIKYEGGYCPYGEFATEEQAKQERDRMNEIIGVSEEEREALTFLSLRFN